MIGKLYLPYDNSWSVNLTTLEKAYLAGFGPVKRSRFCIIQSNPFQMKVQYQSVRGFAHDTATMIVVKDVVTKNSHVVMYSPRCVIEPKRKYLKKIPNFNIP